MEEVSAFQIWQTTERMLLKLPSASLPASQKNEIILSVVAALEQIIPQFEARQQADPAKRTPILPHPQFGPLVRQYSLLSEAQRPEYKKKLAEFNRFLKQNPTDDQLAAEGQKNKDAYETADYLTVNWIALERPDAQAGISLKDLNRFRAALAKKENIIPKPIVVAKATPAEEKGARATIDALKAKIQIEDSAIREFVTKALDRLLKSGVAVKFLAGLDPVSIRFQYRPDSDPGFAFYEGRGLIVLNKATFPLYLAKAPTQELEPSLAGALLHELYHAHKKSLDTLKMGPSAEECVAYSVEAAALYEFGALNYVGHHLFFSPQNRCPAVFRISSGSWSEFETDYFLKVEREFKDEVWGKYTAMQYPFK